MTIKDNNLINKFAAGRLIDSIWDVSSDSEKYAGWIINHEISKFWWKYDHKFLQDLYNLPWRNTQLGIKKKVKKKYASNTRSYMYCWVLLLGHLTLPRSVCICVCNVENVFIYIFFLWNFRFTFVFPFLSPGLFDTIVNTINAHLLGLRDSWGPRSMFNNILCGHKKRRVRRNVLSEHIIKNAVEISTLQVFKPVPFVVCTGITTKNGLMVVSVLCPAVRALR